jgi:hypothetical protein
VLVACGGGGGGDTPPPTDGAPGFASESSSGKVSYLLALAGTLSDTLEPFDVGNFNPPKPEDTQPETGD